MVLLWLCCGFVVALLGCLGFWFFVWLLLMFFGLLGFVRGWAYGFRVWGQGVRV